MPESLKLSHQVNVSRPRGAVCRSHKPLGLLRGRGMGSRRKSEQSALDGDITLSDSSNKTGALDQEKDRERERNEHRVTDAITRT